ncbi:hypothetical protein [Streptomyces pristinaespiralis]|jgi:hypothetical protein|uniref:hypothetical protein n=1 Tax=Streptomyces pristinaespiralis TaxID=38300 RepID=UPI0037B65778
MRKLGTLVTSLGLLALGAAFPSTAQAAPQQGYYCDQTWSQTGRDGYVRAWSGFDCTGTLLGAAYDNDLSWGDQGGAFRNRDAYEVKSVMNNGYVGGRDVVAFYEIHNSGASYVCLSPYELYADDITDNHFTSGAPVNHIAFHRWMTAADCAGNSWLT